MIGALVGCGCDDPERRDAGFDAGHDAGHDAGRDAGTDASHDAGRDAGAAAWTRMPGFPDECAFEHAQNPAALYRPRWEPCPEHPAGCQREVPAYRIRTEVGWHDGERGYAYFAGSHAAIVDLDQGTVAAWRETSVDRRNSACGLWAVGIDDGYAAVYMLYRDLSSEERNFDRVYHAPIEEIGGTTTPIADISPGLIDRPQHLAVTRSIVAAELQPAGLVAVFEEGRWDFLNAPPVLGLPQRVAAVGEFAFWEDWGSTIRIAVGSLDEPAQHLRDIAPGRIRSFHTDGTDLAWVEIFDDPPSLTLYTAPVVFDPTQLEPRRVGPIDAIYRTGVGGGYYASVKAEPERLVLMELTTGRTKTWEAAPGEFITGYLPVYVTSAEVLLIARRLGPGGRPQNYYLRLDPRTIPWDS